MTLSLSLITSKNWPLSFITLFALFAGIPKLVQAASPPPCTEAHLLSASKRLVPASRVAKASRVATAKQFAKAIACLRFHLVASPSDLDAKAQIIRYRALMKDFTGANQELSASGLVGTAFGYELAGDLAWYQGHALASAQHYEKAALSAAPTGQQLNEIPAIKSDRGTMLAAFLWPKAIRGFKAAGDSQALGRSLAKGQALLPFVESGPAKKRLLAALDSAAAVLAVDAQPAPGPELAAKSAKNGLIGYQAAVVSEFIFQDRYHKNGYSHTFAGRGGLKGRNVAGTASVTLGHAPAARWRLGLKGERRERFFSRLAKPVDTVGGIALGYEFGHPRHVLSAEASWVKNPRFTYHNQFSLGYSLPVAVGSFDLSLRRTTYGAAATDRLGAGLSYYIGRWLWLPKAYASHSQTDDGDGRWQGAVDIKGMAFLGDYTAQGWLGGGSGPASQPRAGRSDEQVRFFAYGASLDRTFASLKAGLSAARHSEPRFHQNTIGLNLLWQR